MSEIDIPPAEDFEEVTITAEEEETINKTKIVVETKTEPEKTPVVEPVKEPVTEPEKTTTVKEVEPENEPVIVAENINDGDNSSVSSDSTVEAVEEQPVKETPLKAAESSSSSSSNASDVEEGTYLTININKIKLIDSLEVKKRNVS